MRQGRVQRAIVHQSFGDVVIDKKTKKLLKHLMKQKPSKPIVSLMDEPRRMYTANGESITEYGWCDPEGCTDEEIQKYFDEQHLKVNWPAQWDCSGQMLTVSINWKRNPNGMVSYVHCMALDV
jgi:hypothetical protein